MYVCRHVGMCVCVCSECVLFRDGGVHVPFGLLAAGASYMYVSILPGYPLYVRVHFYFYFNGSMAIRSLLICSKPCEQLDHTQLKTPPGTTRERQ